MGHILFIHWHVVWGYFQATKAELNCPGRDQMACKTQRNCYQALYRKGPLFSVAEAVPLSLGGWVGRCICGERKLRWDFSSTGGQQIPGIPSLLGWEFLLTNDLPLFINLFQATQLISEHKNTLVAHKLAFSTIIYKRDKESIYISNLLHSI